jgi:type VI secretion system protein VasG
MTSNAGTETIEKLCRNTQTLPEPEEIDEGAPTGAARIFKPAFLGRVVTIPSSPAARDPARDRGHQPRAHSQARREQLRRALRLG